MIIKLFREINKLRRFMCGEGLLLTYITICNFTCSFICRNEVVFGISAECILRLHGLPSRQHIIMLYCLRECSDCLGRLSTMDHLLFDHVCNLCYSSAR